MDKNFRKNVKRNCFFFPIIWQTQILQTIEWLKQSIKQRLLDHFHLSFWSSTNYYLIKK